MIQNDLTMDNMIYITIGIKKNPLYITSCEINGVCDDTLAKNCN